MKHTKKEIRRAIRKIEIAIDKIIDLQDDGFGCDATARILESLNALLSELQRKLYN